MVKPTIFTKDTVVTKKLHKIEQVNKRNLEDVLC